MKINGFFAIVLSVLMVACGGGDSKGGTSSQSEQKNITKGNKTTAIKTIFAGDGGSIVFDDGVKLLIPADALSADTDISITKDKANTTFVLRPEGLNGKTPFTLQLPVTDQLIANPEKIVRIYTLNTSKPTQGLGTEKIKVNNLATVFASDLQEGSLLTVKLNRFAQINKVVQDPLLLSYFMPGKYLQSVSTLTFMSALNLYEVTDSFNKITESTGSSIKFRVNPIYLVDDAVGTLSATNLQYGYGLSSDYAALGITLPSDFNLTASNLPNGAAFDTKTGVFTWDNIAQTYDNTSHQVVFSLTSSYPNASGVTETKSITKALTIDIKALVSTQTQTASGTATIPSPQQTISINLTAPVQASSNAVSISGIVTREQVTTNEYNIAYVIDVSGSMGGAFSGTETVSDQNNNGDANELIDGAIASFKALNDNLIDVSNLGGAALNIIKFSGSAVSIYSATVGQRIDVNTALEGLNLEGSTNFEAALQTSLAFFGSKSSTANNFLFFLSDGENNGGTFTDEVSTLRNQNVTIRALGLGSGASLTDLRSMDSNATRVLKPSELTAGLLASAINNIEKVEIYVNQVLIKTILAKDLKATAVGLEYEVDLTTLVIGKDDKIEARVVADDTAATFASAELTIAE